MNKKEALEKAIKVWKTLAANPGMTKEEAYGVLNLNMDMNYCSLCEYSSDLKSRFAVDCRKCPVWGNTGGRALCECRGSPYRKWTGTGCLSKANKKAAKKMVVLLKHALFMHENT